MKEKRETRCDVLSVELLRELIDSPLPFNLAASSPSQSFVRDLYLDTPDGQLRKRGVVCRFRSLDDPDTLLLIVQNLEEGIYITSATGEILDANPAFLLGHGKAARQELETCVSCHVERDCLTCHAAVGGRR